MTDAIAKLHEEICRCPTCKGTCDKLALCPECRKKQGMIESYTERRAEKEGMR